MNKKELGDKMKQYERECNFKIDTSKPVVIRLDGNSFSKFTKKNKFTKPFDERMTRAMKVATEKVMEYCSHVVLGYTQSDEITIILNKMSEEDEFFMGGRVNKICSLLASKCSVEFNKALAKEGVDAHGIFDCRVFNTTKDDAINALYWRQLDCWKNCVSIIAHTLLTGSMHKVSTKEKIKRLKEEGIDVYSDFDKKYHNGLTLYKELVLVPMPEEFKKYPSNKGKDFIERKVIKETLGLITDQKELFNELMEKGYTQKS